MKTCWLLLFLVIQLITVPLMIYQMFLPNNGTTGIMVIVCCFLILVVRITEWVQTSGGNWNCKKEMTAFLSMAIWVFNTIVWCAIFSSHRHSWSDSKPPIIDSKSPITNGHDIPLEK